MTPLTSQSVACNLTVSHFSICSDHLEPRPSMCTLCLVRFFRNDLMENPENCGEPDEVLMEEGITCLVLCPSTFDSPELVWLMCTVLWPASRCRTSTVLLDSAQCAECGRAAFIKNCCYIINKSIRNVGGQFVTASKKPPKYIHKKIHQPHCARQNCLSKHERESECEREELRHWEKPRCIQVHNVKHSANTNTIQSKRV